MFVFGVFWSVCSRNWTKNGDPMFSPNVGKGGPKTLEYGNILRSECSA